MPTSRPDPDWLRLIQESLRRNQELFSSQNVAKQLQEATRHNQELFSSQNVAKQLQEAMRHNQELFGSQNVAEQIQEAMRRYQELFGSQNVAEQLQEAMRRNQELFSSRDVAKQIQESLRRNQELLSSPEFQQRISDALRANRQVLRDSLTDLESAAVEPEAAGLPGEAASWVQWLVALPPLSKLFVLNMLLGLLIALLNQAAAHGAEVPPALTASIGSVVAVVSFLLGVRGLRDDESD